MSAGNLLDAVPEIAQTPEPFERIEKLRNYRGPARTEISDDGWDALRYALTVLVPRIKPLEPYDELPELIGYALLSLQKTRPARQLFLDFCEKAGIADGWDSWWDSRKTPESDDFRSVFILADCYSWEALSNAPPSPAGRFTPVVPNLTAPRPKWLVKNVVPEKALVVLYGKHGTGKSSLALEMGVAIARGTPWHGRTVQPGIVIYVASENAHGLRARLDALLREQGITLDDLGGRFMEITGRPHLLKPDEVTELIKELKTFGRVSAIVFDTLARATAGADENAAKETGVLVENCQTIINATGAMVCLVHHTGKDESRGMRGSSALPAACDTELVIDRPDDTQNFRTVRLGKQRDAADYRDLFSFELKIVELGADEDGAKITSTVVHEVTPEPKSGTTITELPNTPVRRAIRSVLGDAMRPMSFAELITAAKAKLAPPDTGKKDRRRDRVKAAYERMVADKEVTVNGDLVSLSLSFELTLQEPGPSAANDDLVTGGAA